MGLTMAMPLRIAAVYVITLVHIIDGSIVNVAILSIADDLRFAPYAGQWIVTAFGIGMAASVPFVSRWTDWLGTRASFTWALLASCAAMLGCGAANGLEALIVARFVQGVASGMVVLLCQRQLMSFTGPDRRSFALGLWMSAIAIAPVLGPFLGATVIEFVSWRWVFRMLLPVVLICACVIHEEFSLARDSAGDSPRPSLALFAAVALVVGAVQLACNGMIAGDYIAALLWSALAGGAALACSTLLRRAGQRLFDWRLFNHGDYARTMGTAATLNGLAVLNGLIYPLWLQAEFHLGVLDVAAILCAGGLIGGITSPLVGRMKQKAAYPHLVVTGLACFVASFAWSTTLGPQSPFFSLMVPRILLGLGIGLVSPLNFLAVRGLEGRDVLEANSLGMFMRAASANLLVLLGSVGVQFIDRSAPAAATTHAMHVTYFACAAVALALLAWHAAVAIRRAAPHRNYGTS
jgi:MFS transporter, DHA2 family, multidrug resistance protein